MFPIPIHPYFIANLAAKHYELLCADQFSLPFVSPYMFACMYVCTHVRLNLLTSSQLYFRRFLFCPTLNKTPQQIPASQNATLQDRVPLTNK